MASSANLHGLGQLGSPDVLLNSEKHEFCSARHSLYTEPLASSFHEILYARITESKNA